MVRVRTQDLSNLPLSAHGNKSHERERRESSIEFFLRAEPSKEWIDEYARRCSGPSQKGLIYALPEVFPAAEHRFCEPGEPSNVNPDTIDEENNEVYEEPWVGPEILPPQPTITTAEDEIDASQVLDAMPSFNLDERPTEPGPTMFEQLAMGNPSTLRNNKRAVMTIREMQENALRERKNIKSKAPQKRGVNLRVPPTLLDEDIMMSQSSVWGPNLDKHIVVEGGKKYLNLSSQGNASAH